jgi:hypothetical protein
VLIWTTSLAVILGALRACDLLSLTELLPSFRQGIVDVLTAGLLMACVFVVAVWAALGSGSLWQRLPVLLLTLATSGVALALLDFYSYHTDNPGFRFLMIWKERSLWWEIFLDRHAWFGAWAPLAGSLLFASLLIWRAAGFRLVRTVKEQSAVPAGAVPH